MCAQTQPSSTVPREFRISSVYHPTGGQAPAPLESVTLSIYRDEQGGTPLWSETQNVPVDTEGRYSALAGSTLPDGVPADLFATGEPRWLGIRFDRPGEQEQPRVQLVSVPYALKAADSETLGGRPASDYLLAPSAAPDNASSGGAPGTVKPAVKTPKANTTFTSGCVLESTDTNGTPGCTIMTQSSGNIGVGTSTPAYTLDVNGPIHSSSTLFVNDNIYGIRSTSGAFVLATCCSGITAFYSGTNSWGLRNATDSAWLMYVQNGGNLGVGTSTPSYKLDVAGDINLSGILRYQNSPVLRLSPSLQNIGVGSLTLQSITSGTSNTGVGYSALFSDQNGSSNTSVGNTSLSTNVSGSYNTAIGVNSLMNSTSNDNTAVGYGALNGLGSGTNNTAIGYNAGSSLSSTESDDIDIGNTGVSGESGVIRIGSSASQSAFFAAGIGSANVSGVPVVVNTATGQLGISSSSRRYKEDIQDMGDASRGLMRLRPVTFHYKKPFSDGSKPTQYGLIAEEVSEVYPELVAHSGDGQIETVKYQVLDSMLLNEVQRQEREINAQKEQIEALEQQIRELRTAMVSLVNENVK